MLSHTPLINSELKQTHWRYRMCREIATIFYWVFTAIAIITIVVYAVAPSTSCQSADFTINNIAVNAINGNQFEGNLTITYDSKSCDLLVPDSISSSYQNTTTYMQQYNTNSTVSGCQYIDNNTLYCSLTAYDKDKPKTVAVTAYVFCIFALLTYVLSSYLSCMVNKYAKLSGVEEEAS